MDNHGQGGQAPINMALQLLPENGIITPEQFQRNADQISRAREALAVLEQQNAQGHTRYMEQELWNRMQAGRQAEIQLAQLQAQQYAQSAVSSKLSYPSSTHNAYAPQRIPPNAYTSANTMESHGQHIPAQRAYPYQEGIRSGQTENHAQLHQAQPVLPALHHPNVGLSANHPSTQQQQQQQRYPSMQQHVGTAPSTAPTVPQNQSSTESPLNNSYYRPSVFVQTAQTNAVPSASSRASSVPVSNTASSAAAQRQLRPAQAGLPAHSPHSEWQKAPAAKPEIAIARTKATYPSQASSSQAAQQRASADRRIVLEATTRDVYGMMKSLSHDLVISVNRFVIDKLKDKLQSIENVASRLPPNPEDVPQHVSAIGTYVTNKLQNLEAREIIDLLRSVYSMLEQHRAASAGQTQTVQQGSHTQPSVGPQAQPAAELHITAQQSTQVHLQEASILDKQTSRTRAMSPSHHHDHSARLSTRQVPSASTPAVRNFVRIVPAPSDIRSRSQAPRQQTPQPTSEVQTSSSTTTLQRQPDARTIARSILRAFGRPSRAGSHDSHGDDAKKRKRVSHVPVVDQSSEKKQKTGTEDIAHAVVNGSNDPPPAISQSAETVATPPVAYSPTQPHDAALTTDQPLQDPSSSDTSAADPWISPDVVEIKTPGAIQIEAEREHQQLIEGMNNSIQQVNAVLQQFGSAQVIQSDPTAVSPPQSLGVAGSDDQDEQIADIIPSVQDHTLESPPEIQAMTTPKKPALVTEQPVAGPSKVPLFLPSSPTDADSPSKTATVDADGDVEMQDFVPTGLLGLSPQATPKIDKGKQRAVDTADDDILLISSTEASAVQWRKREKVENSSEAEVVETSDLDEKRASMRSKTSRLRRQVYVLAPPLPPAVVRLNEREQQPTDVEVSRAVVQARRRMHEYHCPWQGCDAVLESAMKLGQHAQLHAGENEQWGSFTCRWGNCPEYYSFKQKLAEHLRRHSFENLVCAYADCQQTSAAPKDLARHHSTYHRGDSLKPTTGLITPSLVSLPPLPKELPSYMSVPRRIAKARISPDDHVWLGARVAANITCYVHPGTRAKAAVPSRMTRRVAESIKALEEEALARGWDPKQAVLRMAHDEYDDWMEFDPKMPSFCSDLDSLEISRMVCNGLVLGAVEEPMLEPMPQAVGQEQLAPTETADGMVHHIEADATNDVFQDGVHTAPLRRDDSSIGPIDMHPDAGPEELAELARRPVEDPLDVAGNSWPMQESSTAGEPVR